MAVPEAFLLLSDIYLKVVIEEAQVAGSERNSRGVKNSLMPLRSLA